MASKKFADLTEVEVIAWLKSISLDKVSGVVKNANRWIRLCLESISVEEVWLRLWLLLFC